MWVSDQQEGTPRNGRLTSALRDGSPLPSVRVLCPSASAMHSALPGEAVETKRLTSTEPLSSGAWGRFRRVCPRPWANLAPSCGAASSRPKRACTLRPVLGGGCWHRMGPAGQSKATVVPRIGGAGRCHLRGVTESACLLNNDIISPLDLLSSVFRVENVRGCSQVRGCSGKPWSRCVSEHGGNTHGDTR